MHNINEDRGVVVHKNDVSVPQLWSHDTFFDIENIKLLLFLSFFFLIIKQWFAEQFVGLSLNSFIIKIVLRINNLSL